MEKLKNLRDVNALALPAKVLVLLSKYAQALKTENGTVIKLSSLRVFMHVHHTCVRANNNNLNTIYHQLLREVNQHIFNGTMYTNEEKKMLLRVNKNKQRALNKYLGNGTAGQKKAQPRTRTL